MRLQKLARYIVCVLAVCAIAPSCWAGTWSACQTITAVTDYTACSNSIYVILSPGVSGCGSDAPGSVIFRIGQVGVTADSYKNLFASTMSAFALGKRVMIYYDERAPACFSSIVSIGGTSGQCN